MKLQIKREHDLVQICDSKESYFKCRRCAQTFKTNKNDYCHVEDHPRFYGKCVTVV